MNSVKRFFKRLHWPWVLPTVIIQNGSWKGRKEAPILYENGEITLPVRDDGETCTVTVGGKVDFEIAGCSFDMQGLDR